MADGMPLRRRRVPRDGDRRGLAPAFASGRIRRAPVALPRAPDRRAVLMSVGPPRGRRRTVAERREERAQIFDGEKVVEAAARFLEIRSRSTTEVRRRLVSAG